MEEGTKGTCRYCRQEITMVREIDRWHGHLLGPFWRHTDIERGDCKSSWDDMGAHCANTDNRIQAPHAMPVEWCWTMREDGHYCEKPVRHENIEGHLYACGVHMKKFVENKEYLESRKQAREDQESREAMEEWEHGIYSEALARLNEANPELFPQAKIQRSNWRRWSRTVEVDIADFERWIRELMAYAPGGGGETLWQDDDSVSGLFEPVEGQG
jgi:hypothetical protein